MERDKVDIKQSGTLFVRLLKYAKPYALYLALAVISMLFVTLLDLFGPYLIKVAIDDNIMGFERPMIKVENKGDFVLDGENYAYLYTPKNIFDKTKPDTDGIETYNLMQKDNKYYFGRTESGVEKRILISDVDYNSLRKRDLAGLSNIATMYLISILGVFLFSFVQEYILSVTGQKIIYKIRKDVYHHIISRAPKYFDENPIGRLTTRTTNDIENLNEMYTSVLVSFFQDFFIILGIVIIMLFEDTTLSLISLFVAPFIVFFALRFRAIIQVIYRKSRVVIARINSGLNENITGMSVIQAFKKEDTVYYKFQRMNEEYFLLNKEETQANAKFRPSIEMLRFVAMASLIFFGGGMALKGEVKIGSLFLFITYVGKFFRPILDLTEKYNILQAAISSSERIFTVLDNDMEIKNPENPVKISNFMGNIEFKNVWFAYDDENWVLKDVSFKVNPGESVAFVGATGAGKTSIISLLTRFYDIQKGEILIDGIDIKKLDKHELRKKMAVVQQDVFLFSGTIGSNIRLEDNSIPDEEIIIASEYVNASKFIDKLPKKYDEEVTEKGSTFSQGERQLLSFARTLAQNPDLLILDEATASIDTETEALIQDALSRILKDRSTISVAHRLSTIQNSDKIIVLQQGRIIEEGTNRELLDKKGVYYDLYRLQYKE